MNPPTNHSFVELAEGSKEKNIDLVKVQALFFPLMILLIGISNTLVVYVGGMQYINGTVDLGTIVEFLIYVNMLTWPVAIVGWVTSIVQQAEASQKRINEFLGHEPENRKSHRSGLQSKRGCEFQQCKIHLTQIPISQL